MVIVLALIALAAFIITLVHAAWGKVPLWVAVLLLAFVVLVQLAVQVWR